MFWVQGGMAFALWLAYGIYQMRRAEALRDRMRGICRVRRGVYGGLSLLASAVLMCAGLFAIVTLEGFGKDRMEIWAWLLISGLGLGFVHGQTLGVAMLVSLAYPDRLDTCCKDGHCRFKGRDAGPSDASKLDV